VLECSYFNDDGEGKNAKENIVHGMQRHFGSDCGGRWQERIAGRIPEPRKSARLMRDIKWTNQM